MRVTMVLLTGLWAAAHAAGAGVVTAEDGASLQAVIDANPGRMIHLPDGDYVVGEPVRIDTDGMGLYDHGRIEGITLTRASGREDATGLPSFRASCRRRRR